MFGGKRHPFVEKNQDIIAAMWETAKNIAIIPWLPSGSTMKNWSTVILMLAALTALLVQVKAEVSINFGNPNNNKEESSLFNNLDGNIASANPLLSESGSFTVADFSAAEEFTITVTGRDGWTYQTAGSSLSGLSKAKMRGSNAGWGVDSDADPNNSSGIDVGDEAIELSFSLNPLSQAHRSNFRLTSLDLARWDPGDAYSLMHVDSSGSVLAAWTGQTNASPNLSISISNRDSIIIGHNAGDFRLDGFSIDIIPEPSAYALIGGFLALSCVVMRRRRS